MYNKAYLDEYIKRANTPLAKRLYKARWDLITKHCSKGTVLDYGCATNVCNSFAPAEFTTHGYDINPYSDYDVLTIQDPDILVMWDSLEHISNYYGVIRDLSPKWVFIVTPNLEYMLKAGFKRHYKPEEHIHYFDKHSLKVILNDLGYTIKELNYDEGAIRNPAHKEAILTIVGERNEGISPKTD